MPDVTFRVKCGEDYSKDFFEVEPDKACENLCWADYGDSKTEKGCVDSCTTQAKDDKFVSIKSGDCSIAKVIKTELKNTDTPAYAKAVVTKTAAAATDDTITVTDSTALATEETGDEDSTSVKQQFTIDFGAGYYSGGEDNWFYALMLQYNPAISLKKDKFLNTDLFTITPKLKVLLKDDATDAMGHSGDGDIYILDGSPTNDALFQVRGVSVEFDWDLGENTLSKKFKESYEVVNNVYTAAGFAGMKKKEVKFGIPKLPKNDDDLNKFKEDWDKYTKTIAALQGKGFEELTNDFTGMRIKDAESIADCKAEYDHVTKMKGELEKLPQMFIKAFEQLRAEAFKYAIKEDKPDIKEKKLKVAVEGKTGEYGKAFKKAFKMGKAIKSDGSGATTLSEAAFDIWFLMNAKKEDEKQYTTTGEAISKAVSRVKFKKKHSHIKLKAGIDDFSNHLRDAVRYDFMNGKADPINVGSYGAGLQFFGELPFASAGDQLILSGYAQTGLSISNTAPILMNDWEYPKNEEGEGSMFPAKELPLVSTNELGLNIFPVEDTLSLGVFGMHSSVLAWGKSAHFIGGGVYANLTAVKDTLDLMLQIYGGQKWMEGGDVGRFGVIFEAPIKLPAGFSIKPMIGFMYDSKEEIPQQKVTGTVNDTSYVTSWTKSDDKSKTTGTGSKTFANNEYAVEPGLKASWSLIDGLELVFQINFPCMHTGTSLDGIACNVGAQGEVTITQDFFNLFQ